jgi:hypothetical protein
MIASATHTLESALGSSASQFSLSQLGSLVYKVGLGVLVGFLLYVALSVLGLIGKPFGAKFLRGSLCVLAITLFMVWMFGAFFFAGELSAHRTPALCL